MIDKLHKRDNRDISVEPNEGERTLLCSNRSGLRSPSLDFDPNSPLITEEFLVDHLIDILIEGFLAILENDSEKSSNLLSSINKGTG